MNKYNYFSEMVEKYGDRQLLKASEELSELNVEIMKRLNGEINKENIISELADVYITLDCVRIICDINADEFWKMVDFKIERQIERENGKEK